MSVQERFKRYVRNRITDIGQKVEENKREEKNVAKAVSW